MRAYSFFVVSALAAAVTFAASGERSKPEPSESQMESSFRQFLSTLEKRPDIQFVEFKKHSCKASAAAPGHHCQFTYSTDLPANQIAILPPHATISGTFFADGDGQLGFEMAIG